MHVNGVKSVKSERARGACRVSVRRKIEPARKATIWYGLVEPAPVHHAGLLSVQSTLLALVLLASLTIPPAEAGAPYRFDDSGYLGDALLMPE